MSSTKAKIALAVVLAASVTTPLVLQHQTINRFESEIRKLRAQLTAPPPVQLSPVDIAELYRLGNEHEELMRVRGEVTQLRQQAPNPPKAQKESAQAEPARSVQLERYKKAMALLAESPEMFPMIWSTHWGNPGLATPAAAYQTIKCASANRDIDAILAASGMDTRGLTLNLASEKRAVSTYRLMKCDWAPWWCFQMESAIACVLTIS